MRYSMIIEFQSSKSIQKKFSLSPVDVLFFFLSAPILTGWKKKINLSKPIFLRSIDSASFKMDIEVFQKSHLFEVFEKLQNVNLFIGRVIFRQIYFLYSKETCVNLYYSLYYYYIIQHRCHHNFVGLFKWS